MKTSLQGQAEIAAHEGIVASPYLDSAGVWTFGIGHTSSAGSPDPSDMPRGVTKPLSVVFEVFSRDLGSYERRVNDAVDVTLSQTEFDALVSFDFNTGGIYRAQLTKKLNNGDRAGAAKAFDGWHKPPEIKGRRNKEKALFRDGTYSGGGMANVYPATKSGNVQWAKGERFNILEMLGAPPVPDDPGPTPEPDVEAVNNAWNAPEGGNRGDRALKVLVTSLIIPALYGLRKVFKRLWTWAWRGTQTQKAAGRILLALAAAVIVAVLFWSLV